MTIAQIRADRSYIERVLTDAGANIQNPAKFSCPFHDDRSPSAGLYQSGDSWKYKCHGCEVRGDVFDIVQHVKGVEFPEARAMVLGSNGSPARTNGRTDGKAKPKRLYGTPDAAVRGMLRWKAFAGARHIATWAYQNADGTDAFAVVRFDFDNGGGKQFRPIHPVGDKWAVGDPQGKLPLYRLPQVLAAIEAGETIYVCEGEKAADAADRIGLCATTSAHGSKAAAKSDWSVLGNANVVILPDNDRTGKKYGQAVAGILAALDSPATVRIVDLPDAPKGGDIVDHIEHLDSKESEDIARGIVELAAAAEPIKIHAPSDTQRGSIKLANFATTQDGVDLFQPISIGTIIEHVHGMTDGWPKACGGALFVPAQNDIDWLTASSHLFGYLHHVCGVNWREGQGYTTKGEFFAELLRQADSFDAVERYPHEPPLPNTYYMQRPEVRAPGDALEALVLRFCPATDADRELIRAAFITPMHGGQPGTSPAFAIDSNAGDGGRGVGKTTLATLVGELYGEAFQFGTREDRTLMLKRLLTPGARTTRIAIVDNAKGKLSSEDLEGLITTRTLSGYANYVGEARRPNNIVWFLTANGLELSKDLAQRVVCINLAVPNYDATWREDTLTLIDTRRDEIFADIRELLRAEYPPLRRLTRWASWERAVLSKLRNPEGLQTIIQERSAVADTELDEWHTVVEFFRFKLRDAGYDEEAVNVRIPSAIASRWYIEATGETIKAQTAGRRLRRLCAGKQELQPDPSRTYGRCVLYFARTGSIDDPPVMFSDEHGSLFGSSRSEDCG